MLLLELLLSFVDDLLGLGECGLQVFTSLPLDIRVDRWFHIVSGQLPLLRLESLAEASLFMSGCLVTAVESTTSDVLIVLAVIREAVLLSFTGIYLHLKELLVQ